MLLLKARPSTCAGGAIPSHLLRAPAVSPLCFFQRQICMPLHYSLHHTNILLFLPSKTTTHFYWSSPPIYHVFFGPLCKKTHWRSCVYSLSSIPFLSFSLCWLYLFFKKIFYVDYFLKSLLNLLQYFFCFFFFFWSWVMWDLNSLTRDQLTTPALEAEVLTTGR